MPGVYNHVLFQEPVPAAVTVTLLLNGSNLIVPLTRDTARYCWSHAYVGVLVDCGNSVTEVNEDNNVAFYRLTFDCGGTLTYQMSLTNSTRSGSVHIPFLVLYPALLNLCSKDL